MMLPQSTSWEYIFFIHDISVIDVMGLLMGLQSFLMEETVNWTVWAVMEYQYIIQSNW